MADSDYAPVGVMTLLLVDDDEKTLRHLSWNLELYAGAVITAPNGEAGLAAFREYKPDIVLTDIQMPKMNGIDMAEHIKSISPRTPVVIMTAHEEATYLMKSIEIRADKYLKKPVNVDMLAEVVTDLSSTLLQQRMIEEKNAIIASREAKLAAILENAREGFLSVEPDCSVSDVNRSLLAMLGKKREEVLLKDVAEVFDKNAALEIRNRMRSLTMIGDTVSFELTLNAPVMRHVIINAALIELPGASTCQVNAFFTDITKRRHAETALEASERKFRDLFETHDAGMAIIEPGTLNVVELNRAAANVFGLEKRTMQGRPFPDSCGYNRDTLATHCATVLDTGSDRLTMTIIRSDGWERHVELITNPVEIHDSRYIMSIVRDVTEEIILKEHMHQQSRLATLGQMARSITHHWRQPLTIISLILQDMPEVYAMGELDGEYLAENVAKGLERIRFMSDKLDDIRRFITDTAPSAPFDIRTACRDTVVLFIHEFTRLGIDFSLAINGETVDSEEPISDDASIESWMITGKPHLFREALFQVLANAVDAKNALDGNSADDPPPRPLRVALTSKKDTVSIDVADAFGGIEEAYIGRVSEPYFTTRIEDPTHFGIGLYIARHVVEHLMRGKLAIENRGGGAAITMRFPTAASRPAEPEISPG